MTPPSTRANGPAASGWQHPPSEVVPGIRQVETLVSEREVRDDRLRHRDPQRRPVHERRIDHLHPAQVIARQLDPVDDRAPPTLDYPNPTAKSRQIIRHRDTPIQF